VAKVRELHLWHIKTLLSEKRRQGHAKNSVRLMRAPLSAMLSDAVDDGIIDANPAFQLGRRKATRADKLSAAERVQKIRPMSAEQRTAFLAAAGGYGRYATLFAVLATAGLRPSEAFALKPDDIDMHAHTLRVERALSLGVVKATKTAEARSVDVAPGLLRNLERHLGAVNKEALRRGWGAPEWLFPNESGRPLDIAKVARVFHLASKRAGLPHFRLYDLRHTYASLLLAGGAPITYVSAQLGHANPATTLRYYAKWIPSQGQRWVDLLERGRVAEALTAEVGTTLEPKAEFRTVDDPQLLGRIGSPGRTRTCDLVINSHPLYRLSYRGIPGGRTALYRTRARPDGPTSLS